MTWINIDIAMDEDESKCNRTTYQRIIKARLSDVLSNLTNDLRRKYTLPNNELESLACEIIMWILVEKENMRKPIY